MLRETLTNPDQLKPIIMPLQGAVCTYADFVHAGELLLEFGPWRFGSMGGAWRITDIATGGTYTYRDAGPLPEIEVHKIRTVLRALEGSRIRFEVLPRTYVAHMTFGTEASITMLHNTTTSSDFPLWDLTLPNEDALAVYPDATYRVGFRGGRHLTRRVS